MPHFLKNSVCAVFILLSWGCEGTKRSYVPAEVFNNQQNTADAASEPVKQATRGAGPDAGRLAMPPQPEPIETDAGVAPPQTTCMGGLTACGTECVELESSVRHCGSCASACSGAAACQAGECQCLQGFERCGDACVDLQNDVQFCGSCAEACPGGEVCERGSCRPNCSGNGQICEAACTDVNVDVNNCGACGKSCLEGQVCSAGACQATCEAPFELCGDQCHDVRSDVGHCGQCGVVCEPVEGGLAQDCVDKMCQVLLEDCSNGLDDNRDDLIDCEDPSCQIGYRCLPPAPDGWSDTVALAVGGGGQPVACSGAYSLPADVDLGDEPQAGAAVCDCDCSAGSELCRVEMYYYEGTECDGIAWELSGPDRLDSGACDAVTFDRFEGPGAESALALFQPPEKAGVCTSKVASKPDLSWGVQAVACSLPVQQGAGCEVGACVPNPSEVFEGLCVYKAGEHSCPPAYNEKRTLYSDVTDTRACSCSCKVGCPDSLTAFTGSNCQHDDTPIAHNQCTPIPLDPTPSGSQDARSFEVPDATCPAVQEPSGGVSATGAVTVCCQ